MNAMRSAGPIMWVSGMSVFLNHWFPDYAGARAHLEAEGGFLLPYGTQCFVTCPEAIRERGLDPEDPDWERIGWDWVHPADEAAWMRLRARLDAMDALR
jgi:hypothetical protein